MTFPHLATRRLRRKRTSRRTISHTAWKTRSAPNIVTAILASYRGYDTLGEVTVIFTAGIGVMLLIGGRLMRKYKHEDQR